MKKGDEVFGYSKKNGEIVGKWTGVIYKTYPKHNVWLVEIEGKLCSVKKESIFKKTAIDTKEKEPSCKKNEARNERNNT